MHRRWRRCQGSALSRLEDEGAVMKRVFRQLTRREAALPMGEDAGCALNVHSGADKFKTRAPADGGRLPVTWLGNVVARGVFDAVHMTRKVPAQNLATPSDACRMASMYDYPDAVNGPGVVSAFSTLCRARWRVSLHRLPCAQHPSRQDCGLRTKR